MPAILAIETATQHCSVALGVNGNVYTRESTAQHSHAAVLAGFIADVMAEAGLDKQHLDAVAVSKGPGSYTGLRIGVSAAKGLCFALDKPLLGVGTLHAMALGMISKTGGVEQLYCPMIDARRMEVYYALYDHQGKEIKQVCAEVIDDQVFQALLAKETIVFFGDGAEKCRTVIKSPRAVFASTFEHHAQYVLQDAFSLFCSGQIEDTAYFEPFYLKDFVAGKPRVKGLK